RVAALGGNGERTSIVVWTPQWVERRVGAIRRGAEDSRRLRYGQRHGGTTRRGNSMGLGQRLLRRCSRSLGTKSNQPGAADSRGNCVNRDPRDDSWGEYRGRRLSLVDD